MEQKLYMPGNSLNHLHLAYPDNIDTLTLIFCHITFHPETLGHWSFQPITISPHDHFATIGAKILPSTYCSKPNEMDCFIDELRVITVNK